MWVAGMVPVAPANEAVVWQPDALQSIPGLAACGAERTVLNWPPWQPSQRRAETTVWFMTAPVNAAVPLWQLSQVALLVGMWPVTGIVTTPANLAVPWQVAQAVAVTTVWFMTAPVNAAVPLWQDEQAALFVGM